MKKYAFYAVFLGLLVLLISWSAQGCIELIQSGFAQSTFLGWCVVLGFTSVVTGILYLLSIECRGYVAVRRVDALAASLQDNDLRLSRKYTVKWLTTLSQTERIAMVEQATSVHEIRTILLPIVDMIDTKIDAVIAKESLLTGAVVGISPWPLIDGAVVAWRQLRLMRSIATAYGVRPGTIGTIRLLKKVVFSVAFADASEHVMQWISAKIPSMGGLIPSAGQAVATAVLTARLGKSCKSACRPLKIGNGKSPSTFSKMKRFCKQSLLQYRKQECTPPTSGRATTRSADS